MKTRIFDQGEKSHSLKEDLCQIIEPGNIAEEDSHLSTSSFFLKDTWRSKPKSWGNPMHSMASRSGSFPPALADYFISNFSRIGDIILDPYSGKGTAPYQACLLDRVGFGLDVTPEAYVLTGAKVYGISHSEAVEYLKSKRFGISRTNIKEVPSEVKIFFSTKTLAQILVIKERLLEDFCLIPENIDYLNGNISHFPETRKQQIACYWLGILVGILHGSSSFSLSLPCSHSFSMAPNYTKNYAKKHGLKKPDRNVIDCMIRRSKLLQSTGIPRVFGKAYLGKAEELPKSWNEKFDLILTSPPYFTAQSYPWDNWLREWVLGFDFKEVRLQTTYTANYEKYSMAMHRFLKEAYRVLKSGKRAFVVVGDVKKKSANGEIIIKTSDIIANEANKTGFKVDLIINDDIPPTRRYNSSYLTCDQGLQIDRIVCLRKA